ncbi:hypothetical protein PVA45_05395 [Entomospira entomophila]|uniref:Tetratricopeptide repeat protein n=1 Tax=Entomospira entomophila TaxID=2719988 RepID=A0A968KRN5_9SPIO|nr:hypothetical protein [Entomospira entomophilus]NIZ40933.1 hypothetical protein [Entomospira entomophilus]WDI35146.1 hypothetical protein PVA45_05395 [Entomospira entomophilus]
MRYPVSLVLFSLLMLILLPATIIAQSTDLDEFERVLQSNNYQVISHFMQSIDRDHHDWSMIALRYAQFLIQKGLVHQAIEELEQIQSDVGYIQLQIDQWLSYAYSLSGNYLRALHITEKMWQSDPTNESILQDYLWLLYKNFKTAEAITVASQYEYLQSPFLFSMIALLHGDIGNYERAIQYYALANEFIAIEELSPENLLPNYYNQYILEIDFLQFQKAEELLIASLEIDPDSPAILRLLGNFYHQQMNLSKSQLYYEQSEFYEMEEAKNNPHARTPLSKLGLIDLYLDFGKLEDVYPLLEEIIQQKDNYLWMKAFGINPSFFESRWRAQEVRYWELKQKALQHQLPTSIRGAIQQFIHNIQYKFSYRRAKLNHRRSQLNSADYARNMQNLENFLRYSLQMNDTYHTYHQQLAHASMKAFRTPIDHFTTQAQLTMAGRKKTQYLQLMSEIILPYQQNLYHAVTLRALERLSLRKEEKNPMLSRLYIQTPFFAQFWGIPAQITMDQKLKNKRLFKKMKIHETPNAEIHITITHESTETLAIHIYHQNELFREGTIQIDPSNRRAIYESIRRFIFQPQ